MSYNVAKTDEELSIETTFIGFDNGLWAVAPKDISLQLNYHSIHWAQVQTIIRQQGIEPDFVDYINKDSSSYKYNNKYNSVNQRLTSIKRGELDKIACTQQKGISLRIYFLQLQKCLLSMPVVKNSNVRCFFSNQQFVFLL